MCRHVLSIDGGGTKTAGLVADVDGNLRCLKIAQGCNPQDNTDWKVALGAIVDQARAVDFAVIGMPGFGEVPDHDEEVESFFETKISAGYLIINDVELAFRGAFPDGDGVLVLAGTGSMAIGRAGDRLKRSGGWGHRIGDEGSAFWIGQQALSRATAELDGRAPSLGFAVKLVQALGAPDHPFGILDWVMKDGGSRARIASVAKAIDDISKSGDVVAGSILDSAADHLIALAQSVSPNAVPWSYAGSVFESARIKAEVAQNLGPPTPPAACALIGGVRYAAQLAGWATTPDWTNKVLSQTQHFDS